MSDPGITQLSDLARLRGAPELSPAAADRLRAELATAMSQASWFTVGAVSYTQLTLPTKRIV